MQKDFKKLILFILLLCAPAGQLFAQSNYMRVMVFTDNSSLRVKARGSFKVIDPKTKKTLYSGRRLNATAIPFRDGIAIGNIRVRAGKVFIKSEDPDEVIINGRSFRGDVVLLRGNNTLSAVNYIELEDYVKGILYHETSHYWPIEALKAQAISSRTYAVYQREANKAKDFDVTSDIYSQVYGGQSSERFRTSKAVEETKGEVLTYEDKAIPAFFHATCGGRTEDASKLWDVDITPLKGVECGFCKGSPHFNWHYVISLNEISRKLNSGGIKVGDIKGIEIVNRDTSGRAEKLKLTDKDSEKEVLAKDFRRLVDPNMIRSTNFSVRVSGEDAVFEGVGWGHGAGLCQWGAYFMAKQGYTAGQILSHYYPGTEIKAL